MSKSSKVGDVFINKRGVKATLVEYESYRDITVEFDDGFKKSMNYKEFKNRAFTYPYERILCGVGFHGEGIYETSEDGIKTNEYVAWNSMMRRAYAKKYHARKPSYMNCTVCEEWHNFQNFAKWHEDNYYYENETEKLQLDKDLLNKNNKIYSPDTCVFVPKRLNTLLLNCKRKRGLYPIGVRIQKGVTDKYVASHMRSEGKVHLGSFSTPEQAFKVYKTAKEKYIKEVAEEYKNKIPLKLYEAMLNYKIEITD